MNSQRQPFVSAVIPTCQRGATLIPAIESVLANDYPNFELIIVDQSTDDETAHAIRICADDERVRYIRSQTRGLSNARNIALRAARGEIVAFTDDDCVVPPAWLTQMTMVFQHDPQLVMVFSDLVAAKYNAADGHIPVHISLSERSLTSIAAWRRTREQTIGLGATMALRREIAQMIGGFDPELGVGARFRSGGELDIALRGLLAGYHVLRLKEPAVVHYGFRTWAQSSRLFRGYSVGPAASFAKLARCGHVGFVWYFLEDAWREALLPSLQLLAQLKRPRPLGRIGSLIGGFAHGWRTAIEHERSCFVSTGDCHHAEEISPARSPLAAGHVFDSA